jgi:hypothetical protein
LGSPGTYQHPLIPEDVLMDKSGLEALLEQTTLSCSDPLSSNTKEKVVEEKVEGGAVEAVLSEDVMAVTDVGSVSCLNVACRDSIPVILLLHT